MSARRGREAVVHAVVVAVVLAGGLAVNHVQRYGASVRSFVAYGEPGERLDVWPGSVVVHGVRASRTLDVSESTMFGDPPPPPPTDGVWVAVDLAVAGGDQPGPVPRVQLVDASDRTFEPTNRARASYPGRAQPGSQHRWEVVFEIPADAVGPVTVVVADRFPYQLGAEAHVATHVGPVSDEPLVPDAAALVEPFG
ncbi:MULTISPECIES: hypothetical protein [unclassified Actinotalea]|uniref:hypothetical protein n=1 Tax=unclassified Actinotalea TaxID=2638618 RepID=UPI0015F5F2FE|nr:MULTISPECIES: hypothetical protein [unclassified Actinotalea]